MKTKITDREILNEIYHKYIMGIPYIKALIIPTLLCMFVSRILEVKLGVIMQQVAQEISSGNESSYPDLIRSFFIVAFLSCLLIELQGYIFTGPIQRAFREASKSTFKKYLSMEHTAFHKMGLGAIQATIDRKSKAVSEILDVLIINFLPVTLVIILSTWKISNILGHFAALILNITLIAYGFITISIAIWRNEIRKEMNKSINRSSDLLYDSLSNFDVVKAFNNERVEAERYDITLKDLEAHSNKLWKSFYFLNFLQRLVFALQTGAIIYFGLYGYLMKQMTSDEFILYMAISRILASNLDKLGYMYSRYSAAMTNAKMSAFPIYKPYPKLLYPLREFNYNIQFKDVSLSHAGHLLLDNINITINRGEKIAIIGANGVGKSSLIKVLMGFAEYNGIIMFDGEDISHMSPDSIRDMIAYVPQEPLLFNETVKYNLKYSNPECSDYNLVSTCKKFNIHASISRLDGGYNAMVGHRGSNLSGGEKQKISLIRAFLKDTEILVMDEPTANLDKESENEIIKTTITYFETKTMLMIIHNLELLPHFDRIFYIGDGTVTEVGLDHEFIKKSKWAN
ncbi:ABC transporter B family member 5 [Astathelohania contejeani]|uniref:ABC transporter B family member 5 n=1 Tax=Astathelohania contejeani TaxID=164912 RepID=A0ABQ7HZ38_9MICR|nr:ABC transporter B family member 5 [Thelohania contejeani]